MVHVSRRRSDPRYGAGSPEKKGEGSMDNPYDLHSWSKLHRQALLTELERPRREEVSVMRTYYWKVFRHILSTALLTGFSAMN